MKKKPTIIYCSKEDVERPFKDKNGIASTILKEIMKKAKDEENEKE